MRYVFLLVLFVPIITCAQNDKVRFVEGLSWSEVIEKAKVEKKYIFVDCYTTWCGPCRWMDKEVFATDTVAAYVNENFISIKLQIDTAKNDQDDVRSKYRLAADFKTTYRLREYPTFLFFGYSGQPLHKAVGTLTKKDLIKLCNQVKDTSKQYYTLLNAYNKGNKDYRSMSYLAITAKRLNDDSIAKMIARDYIGYLSGRDEDEIISKTNVEFVYAFKDTIRVSDKIFSILYRKSKIIDSMMGKDYSIGILDYIISVEELAPAFAAYLKYGKVPRWRKLKHIIKKKYPGEYADRIIINSKVMHFKYTKEFKMYVNSLVKKISRYGIGDVKPASLKWWFLNNYAFEVFMYSDKKKELKTALNWINEVIQKDAFPVAAHLDTKANILYKLNKKREAIELEEKALSLALNDKDIKETYEKMNKGIPTWSIE